MNPPDPTAGLKPSTQTRTVEPKSLPRGLWIGTAVFAVLSAVALAVSMRVGRSAIEAASAERIEKAMAEPGMSGDPEENRRQAMAHWNSGLIHFQSGDSGKARLEWEACRRLDPTIEECQKGLKRLN